MTDTNVFRKKVVKNMTKISQLMMEIEDLNHRLVDKYDKDDYNHYFNECLPCGGDGYPFGLSFDEQILAINSWVEQIEDMIQRETDNTCIKERR